MARNMQSSSSRKNRLSDRDMLMDLLVTQKYLSHFYDHAVMESSSSNIRDTFEALQQDEHETGRTLFNVMQERGWYSVSAGGQRGGYRGQQNRRGKNNQQQYDISADSSYGVTSGSQQYGNRLRQRDAGKNGFFSGQQQKGRQQLQYQ